MNEERRKKLKEATRLLSEAKSIIDEIKIDEEEAYENLPEAMQNSDKGEKAQAAIEALSEAYDACENAEGNIDTAAE